MIFIFISDILNTESSCVNLVSGEGGELMTDGDDSTCAPVNQVTPDGAVLQYSFSVKGKCIENDIVTLRVNNEVC